MRMSCHGCRVLRKGCSNVCIIRPCLQWITSPEAQANATLFLAKFYGRAGLINLINAGPPHLRPAIFRSLLYEACGRIINPVYGSVGFLWSGSWRLCQAAVESVLLRGEPTAHFPTSDATGPKIYDIRHVTKTKADGPVAGCDLHNVAGSSRGRFKRIGNATKPHSSPGSDPFGEIRPDAEERSERENSVGAPKGSSMSQGDPEGRAQEDEGDAELELTLGFEPATRVGARGRGPVIRPDAEGVARSAVGCPVDLGLSLC